MKKQFTGHRFLLISAGLLIIVSIFTCGCSDTLIDNTADLQDGWSIIRPPSDVESLVIFGDYVAAGGKEGVFLIDRQSGNLTGYIDCGFDIRYVSSLLADKKGNLWIGFNGGLVKYNSSGCTLYTTENGLLDNRVNALCEDSTGRILAGTWGGVSIFDNGKWTSLTSKDGLADDMVNVIYQDNEGGIWFGSYVAPAGGVSLYKNGMWYYFNASGELPHNNINAIAEDEEGGIWIGTGLYDRGGAVRLVFDGERWISTSTLSKDDGLAGDKVRSLFIDNNGDIWFGSEYDGLTIKQDNIFRIISVKEGLSDTEVKCFLMDSEKNLWIGTFDGITKVSRTALEKI